MSPSSGKTNSSDSDTYRQNFVRQIASKRRTSDDCDQDDTEDNFVKRECIMSDNFTTCPLAKYGCIEKIPSEHLKEHYLTDVHQKILMKLIEMYEQHSQDQPCCDSEISNLMNTLAEGVSCLNDDNSQIYTNVTQLQNIIIEQQKQIVQLKQSIEETSQTVRLTQVNNHIVETELQTMKQTVTNSSNLLSSDGSYTWKITNVDEHIANAISERQTSIYSPAFYSSTTGYKMCMRLYFNGDGNARRTHLSLFFVLMRGDYDAILHWPFNYKVTFCLYDLTGTQRHIIDSFRSDIKSNSFQQPRSDMNLASGIPKFFPLVNLQQTNNLYIRDNSMFIRCIIDFDSVPKTCLPFMINLNPALPPIVQKKLIENEIEQRRKAADSVAADRTNESK